ncbi:hypothetical protein C8Q69DRAFT_252060 [Paecilomyces variotii]|uniref:Uncharacterized protein n=1 Tax=Byssochlamys spectabilis TaxID=264951 RepID=A0A443HUF6_BYSSP|nr:hypothetical protein C8Q69DRAFT_252060 [Paecilomyces variotii]RWQ95400.1 hypothetical protein C8Q69DRAFT_252060 [Paecilomyces variotii]
MVVLNRVHMLFPYVLCLSSLILKALIIMGCTSQSAISAAMYFVKVTRLSSSTKSTIPSRRQANYTATSVLGIGELETYTKHLSNADSSTTKFVGIVVDVASNRSAVKARNTKTIGAVERFTGFLGYMHPEGGVRFRVTQVGGDNVINKIEAPLTEMHLIGILSYCCGSSNLTFSNLTDCAPPSFSFTFNFEDVFRVQQGTSNVLTPQAVHDTIGYYRNCTQWAIFAYLTASCSIGLIVLISFTAVCSRLGSVITSLFALVRGTIPLLCFC